ncbi:MAG: glycerate kinase, partial [Clostridia bacterium]|nr:glycerate kinase [Clostridia bacterium]
GGYADGSTAEKLRARGIDINDVLMQNDSYHALKAADGLIVTGPTGTNVNDVSVALIG